MEKLEVELTAVGDCEDPKAGYFWLLIVNGMSFGARCFHEVKEICEYANGGWTHVEILEKMEVCSRVECHGQ